MDVETLVGLPIIGVHRQILAELSITMFYENMFSGSRIITFGQAGVAKLNRQRLANFQAQNISLTKTSVLL
jgi:hypothetical protein